MEEEVTRAANAPKADLTKLQCGNLIYADTKSSISFADKFLSDVAANTNLNVGKNFVPVRLEADNIFNFPFCVWSGGDSRKYHHGEFSHPFDYAKFWPVVAHGREPAVKAK